MSEKKPQRWPSSIFPVEWRSSSTTKRSCQAATSRTRSVPTSTGTNTAGGATSQRARKKPATSAASTTQTAHLQDGASRSSATHLSLLPRRPARPTTSPPSAPQTSPITSGRSSAERERGSGARERRRLSSAWSTPTRTPTTRSYGRKPWPPSYRRVGPRRRLRQSSRRSRQHLPSTRHHGPGLQRRG